MLADVAKAQAFFKEKFGEDVQTVPDGDYAVPVETSKGPAFMKVTIKNGNDMSDFKLYLDEALTQSWYDENPGTNPRRKPEV